MSRPLLVNGSTVIRVTEGGEFGASKPRSAPRAPKFYLDSLHGAKDIEALVRALGKVQPEWPVALDKPVLAAGGAGAVAAVRGRANAPILRRCTHEAVL